MLFSLPNLTWLGIFLIGAMLMLTNISFFVYEAGGTGITDRRTLDNYINFLTDPHQLGILMRSLGMALVVVMGTMLLAFPIAITLSRATGMKRTLLYFAVLAPLMTSVVIRTFGWMMLLSNNGILATTARDLGLLDGPMRLLYNMSGVNLVMVQVHLPFMILAIDAALLNINQNVYEAARNLGASRLRIFWQITVPLCRPGLISGAVMVFALSLSSFVTPSLIGGAKNPVMAMLIFQEGVSLLNWPVAGAIALILLTILLVSMTLFLGLTGHKKDKAA